MSGNNNNMARWIRVATYNVHKCRGFDGRITPERVVSVIKELDADILCLQEVVNAPGEPLIRGSARIYDQAGEIARALSDYTWAFGANRPLHGGVYGNMTLTRLPLRSWRNYDLTRPERSREERGVLQTEIEIGHGESLNVFNVHLGTGPVERRYQGEKLLSREILAQPDLTGPRLVLGDFNEWTRGLTTRLLKNEFQSFRPQHLLRFPRTFPGMLPFLSLDHFYFEAPLELESTRLFRTRRALVASDHLPLVADFRIRNHAA